MKLLPVVRIALLLAIVAGAARLGAGAERYRTWYAVHEPERAVAALPGIGQGWLDTLRMVAGPTTIDTISPIMAFDDGPELLGVFETWHMTVSIRTDIHQYFQFQRVVCGMHSFGYVHPVTLATPAAVVAHEFGHRFQMSLWPGLPGWPGDTLPTYAQDNPERFADRFARAMLALRGWDTPDSTDVVLNHVVRMHLLETLAQ